mmetsp:Transcript_25593/g.60440  ORF Transcript_25593/g.60440 Transcript_25593/m.60440 type:complete len:408 (+) Transcript_25593:1-1224(+)
MRRAFCLATEGRQLWGRCPAKGLAGRTVPWHGGGVRPGGARGLAAEGSGALELNLDRETVDLHRRYHDKTIEYTMENMEWVQSKAYGTDKALTPEKQVDVRRAARARLFRWPRLDERDMHEVPLGPSPQRFCPDEAGGSTAATLGDPEEHVFVISLPRRPSKLQHVLLQLQEAGVSATVVDAIDGDAVLAGQDLEELGVSAIPGYSGHTNHKIHLTTGEVGCFMSHFTIWHHMVEHGIESAVILEDDFDFQEDFAARLGQHLREAAREDWNLFYVGRSPVEPDLRRISDNLVEPGYTLWTVGYLIRLDAARALLEASVEKRFVPLDEFFSLAMGRYTTLYNEFALEWAQHIPVIFRPLAVTPPLVMPYVGSMFESDTAMLRRGTRYVKDLPATISDEEAEAEIQMPL